MQVLRRGYHKNKGTKTLISAKLNQDRPRWQVETWSLFFRVKGVDAATTYEYDVKIGADELASMVEAALRGTADGVADEAQAKAIGAYIREALDQRRQPERYQPKAG